MPRSALWLPDSARAENFRCLLCDASFDSNDRFRRHMRGCVVQNEPEVPEKNAFKNYVDEEQVAWVKKANREGRRMKGILGAGRVKR